LEARSPDDPGAVSIIDPAPSSFAAQVAALKKRQELRWVEVTRHGCER
jgi:hypothetical protein